jgi:hypothetical protein
MLIPPYPTVKELKIPCTGCLQQVIVFVMFFCNTCFDVMFPVQESFACYDGIDDFTIFQNFLLNIDNA